jgi:histidyl-tRNA synthetase
MQSTKPASGMRDFLPEDVRRREYVIGVIKQVYERYGFEPLETPAVENIETLLGKYGDEGNKLIFKILKRGEHEASGQADLALRYDLTVPLARVVAQYQDKLPRLFKRYQIQPVWRADRPGRGRFREFYQCDVDSVGSTSPLVEAEVWAAVAEVLTRLGFSDFVIRINHRALLTSTLNAAGIAEDLHATALVAVDKLDKIGVDGVGAEMSSRGITAAAAGRLLEFFGSASPGPQDPAYGELDRAAAFVGDDAAGGAAIADLRAILQLVEQTKAAGKVRVDTSLARGLSYYTGAIMEVNVADLAGSIGGGGRYDNLVGMFLGQQIPACGFSLGLERILVVMTERNMFPPALALSPADVLMASFDAAGLGDAMRVAGQLREQGLRVFVYPDADKIGKQIKYADSRGIPFVAMLGDNERRDGTLTIKNLATQAQDTQPQAAAGAAIIEALRQRG